MNSLPANNPDWLVKKIIKKLVFLAIAIAIFIIVI